MQLNYQLSIPCYVYKLLYVVSLMVTTKQHPIVDTQKIKESKHINKESQQTIKERAREDKRRNYKTIN